MNHPNNHPFFLKQTLTRFNYLKTLFLVATIIAIGLFLIIPIIFISVIYQWYRLMPSYLFLFRILSPVLVSYLILATFQRLVDTGLSYKNGFICFSLVLMANFTNSKMLVTYLQNLSKPAIYSVAHPIHTDSLLLSILGWLFSGLLVVILFLPSNYFKPFAIQDLAKSKKKTHSNL